MLACVLAVLPLSAQVLDPTEVVPSDSTVRTGVLPGGSTYYIKQNDKPANRADFYIYYKVGAIQEEDNQNGLAHFLEHMAFNGSKHFPGNSLDEYLATIGVRFGENLNAWTGQESTAYMITNVPLARETIIDSVLLILHDWAGFINLEGDDIDKERGVILEEWRQRNGANMRVMEKQMPVIYNNSLYSRRNIIGNPDVLTSFKHDELRDFYHRWYRPDMQAFVIVGDFDPDVMEQKLKETMADIPRWDVTEEKAVIVLDDNDQPLISVLSDPELTGTQVQVLFRHEPLDERLSDTYAYFARQYATSLVSDMFTQRLSEIARQENAPFLGASGGYSKFIRPADMFYTGAMAREDEALRTLEAVYTELIRIKNHGFTQSELDRAKTKVWRSTESYFENRNDRKNGEFINDFFTHFESGVPYITPETDLEVTRRVLDAVTLANINLTAANLVGDKNEAVLISLPAKEGLPVPTEEQVREVLSRVRLAELEAYVDDVEDVPLLDAEKLTGSKVIESEEGKYESQVLTLANGVKVVVKPTVLKADEVQMTAFQKGGYSLLDDLSDFYNVDILPSYMQTTGVAGFSRTDLQKLLTGKIARATPNITALTQGFSGSSSPKDLETMLQLVYLYYTQPRFEQSDWNVMMNQYRSRLPNLKNNPNYIFQDSVRQTLYGHDPRAVQTISETVLDAASLEKVDSIYRSYFSNAYGMTFILVGNLDMETTVPLLEKYLGSLPASPRENEWVDNNVLYPVGGQVSNIYQTPLETPKVTVLEVFSGYIPYSIRQDVAMNAVRYMLEMRYTKSIREEKGGTYGVGVSLAYRQVPRPLYMYQIYFDTDADKVDELLPIVREEMQDLMTHGATADELTKTKEFFTKRYHDNLIQNGTWLGYLNSWYQLGNDHYGEYMEAVNALNAETIREAARKSFEGAGIVTVIQKPANQ